MADTHDPPGVVQVGPIYQTSSVTELQAALAAFQASVEGASKGGKNPHFHSRYTRLEDAWRAARAPLTAAGLSVSQWPAPSPPETVTVVTRLGHSSGQWMQCSHTMPVDTTGSKNAAQQVGSTLTYTQRYAFLAVLGLPPEDDDAQGAGHAHGSHPKKRRAKPKAAPQDAVRSLEQALRTATTSADYDAACTAIAARTDLSAAQLAALRATAREVAKDASWRAARVVTDPDRAQLDATLGEMPAFDVGALPPADEEQAS